MIAHRRLTAGLAAPVLSALLLFGACAALAQDRQPAPAGLSGSAANAPCRRSPKPTPAPDTATFRTCRSNRCSA